METKQKTYGDKIKEEVDLYKKCYRTLVKVGNKHPSESVATEIKMKIWVWQRVAEEMYNFFEEEKKRLKEKRTKRGEQ